MTLLVAGNDRHTAFASIDLEFPSSVWDGRWMKIATMRRMDYWLGIPACAALSMLRAIKRAVIPTGAPREQQAKVLLIELSEMGSMVAALPAMAKVQSLSPDVEIHFLTFAKNRKCLELLDVIPEDQVHGLRDDSLSSLMRDIFRVIRTLRRMKIDYVIDMEIFSRVSAILTALVGAKQSSGFDADYAEGLYRGRLHTHPVHYNPYTHIGYNFLALVRAFHLDPSRKNRPFPKALLTDTPLRIPRLQGQAKDREKVRDVLTCAGWKPDTCTRLVLVNPNGGALPIRAWPLESYRELIRQLLEDSGVTVAIMGIDGAVQDAEWLIKELKSPERLLDVTNGFSFRQLIPLFEEADLLVTNDGGPAHFASLTECRSLVFFGPETPALYGPLGDRSETLFSGLHCSPCLSGFNHRFTACQDNQCLKQITVEEAFDRCRGLLEQCPPRVSVDSAPL